VRKEEVEEGSLGGLKEVKMERKRTKNELHTRRCFQIVEADENETKLTARISVASNRPAEATIHGQLGSRHLRSPSTPSPSIQRASIPTDAAERDGEHDGRRRLQRRTRTRLRIAGKRRPRRFERRRIVLSRAMMNLG